MSLSLSCNTKDYATMQNTLDYDYAKDGEKNEFSPKTTILNRFDFYLYKKGEKPVYCGMPFINGLASDGSGARVIYTSCGTMGCPTCGDLWALQRVFESAVLVEAYAKYSRSRPAHGQGSINYDRSFTLEDIRLLGRRVNHRLKKQGVDAGLKMIHPFRIKDNVKKGLRQIIGKSNSSGYWKFIRDDYNAGNIDKLNEVMGSNLKDYLDCVFLAPHYHFISFPGNQKFTGDKNVVLKKESFFVNGNKEWVLKDAESVVKYLMYLITHTGQLNNPKHHLKLIFPFGGLFKLKLNEMVTDDELKQIRSEVLEVLNKGRAKPLEFDGETIVYQVPKEKEEKIFIPMSEFRLTSLLNQENTSAFISGLRTQYGSIHADYVKYVIDLWNYLQDNADVPQKFKRIFTTGFNEVPVWVCLLDNDSRSMFESGICDPPDSFKFFVNGNFKEIA